ncbi:MAG TPA: TSUP family transporter, partial [Ramlibacter sp.]
ALGARTLLVLPSRVIDLVLGIFFMAMIPVRQWMLRQSWRLSRGHMAIVGAAIGFATGLVVSTGPLGTPFFLMHGLVKGAFLGTEAMSSIGVYVAKAVTFRSFGALPLDILVQGLIVGSTLLAGAFIAKRYVRQLDPSKFRLLMDGVMFAAGAIMLLAAANG